jgi:RNA polymerase sigma factor CnrH
VTGRTSDASDGALVEEVLRGGQRAFAELMRRHRDPIYRMVRGHIGDAEEALDIVQETFTAAYRGLSQFDVERPFRTWVSRIAINKCRDWARRRAVRRFFSFALPIEQADHVVDDAPAADMSVGDRQDLDKAYKAIADLPASLKEPLILCAIEGLTQAEAASALSLSDKALEMRIYRARARLAENLARK